MKLFLSYNSENREFVKHIAGSLRQNNYEVFFDTESIDAGDKWVKVIQDGIQSSNASLIFIGDEGIGSWQNKEVISIVNRCTKENSYRIIPVITTELPQLLIHKLPWFLADYQWVEFKDKNDEHALKKLLEGLKAGRAKGEIPIGENPYKGLESFNVSDQHSFFGRTYDLNRVFHYMHQLQSSILKNNFLAIIADSGTGKSSFVKAGLMAALQNGRMKGSQSWKQIIFKPGNNPLLALSSNLQIEKLVSDSRQFEEKVRKHDDELLRVLSAQKDTWVIYIDQFEEVISQCKDEKERIAFLNNIARAPETEQAIILLSLRSDFYAAFAHYTLFKGLLEKNNYTLSSLDINKNDDDNLFNPFREIIIRPAENAGVKFAPELADTLCNDIKHIKGPLPILELTLDLLWKNRANKSEITLDDYAKIAKNKNIAGIIQMHADKVYNDITNSKSDNKKADLFKKIFVPHLVEINDGGENVRRTVSKKDLLGISGYSAVEVEDMIQQLSDPKSRLLNIRQIKHVNQTETETKIDVVHEVIIREWPLLLDWINDRREALKYEKRIRYDADDYKNGIDELYSGKKLKEANEWSKKNPDLTNDSINKLIASSNNQKIKTLSIAIGIPIMIVLLFALLYSPVKKWLAVNEIKNLLNVELQAAGGDIDSIKTLTIDGRNYLHLTDKVRYFKNLDTLVITGTPLTQLPDLSGLNIHAVLKISGNYNLTDLRGIEKLASVSSIQILNNYRLISMEGLENLFSLQSLNISYNENLGSLKGLENLTSIDSLIMEYNKNLSNLSNLQKIRSVHYLSLSESEALLGLFEAENQVAVDTCIIQWCFFKDLSILNNLKSVHSLSLYNNNYLHSLKGIESHNSLKSLKLDDNDILSDLSGLEFLDSLTKLSILSGSFKDLKRLENLPSLNELTISCKSFKNLNGLKGLNSITTLNMSENFSKDILSGIGNLPSLSRLSIEYNDSLTDLNDSPYIKSLRFLEIHQNNSLRSLRGIQHVNLLDSLIISGNDSLSLEGMEELNNLKYLKIYNNLNIINFQYIEKLTNLTSLYIFSTHGFNGFKEMKNFNKMQSLIIIGIDSITKLGGLEKMASLRFLKIIGNSYLASLSGLEYLDSLEFLEIDNLDNSFLFKLSDRLTSLQSLEITNSIFPVAESIKSIRFLSINHSRLYTLEDLEKLNSVDTLCIEENLLLGSLKGLESIRSLKYLKITDNNYLVDLQSLHNLSAVETLEITGNERLTAIKGFENLHSLHSLTIENNNSLVDLSGFKNLDSLKRLEIKNNDSLPNLDGFKNLKAVNFLKISNNSLLHDLRKFENLTSVETLYLSGSNFTSLDGIQKFKTLKFLTLQISNPSIDLTRLYELRNLKKVTVEKNIYIDYNRLLKNNPGVKLKRIEEETDQEG